MLLGFVGGSIDYARLVARRSQLQSAVDAGALAGGNALKLASSNAASVRGVTEQIIVTNAPTPPNSPLAITVTVADDKTSVSARVEDRVSLTFGRFIGFGTQTVAAQAKVSIVGKMRLCMLTLDPGAPGAFNLQKNAQVVYRRRTMTLAKLLLTNCKHTKIRILGGVTIGADRDPAYQRDLDDAAMS